MSYQGLNMFKNGQGFYLTFSYFLLQITLTSSSMYLLVLSGISTLLSMYGLIALFRHVFRYLRYQRLVVKFLAIQVAIVLHNVQPLVFGVLGSRFGVPECIESRGPRVRASSKSFVFSPKSFDFSPKSFVFSPNR